MALEKGNVQMIQQLKPLQGAYWGKMVGLCQAATFLHKIKRNIIIFSREELSMENGKYTLRFFLGANTPQGFVSRFDQLADPDDGWRKYVIKGGPGTGKSRLMKQLAGELSHRCNKLELIYCSSDTNSLDAVIATDLKAAIADGTSPHGGRTQAHKCTMSPTMGTPAGGLSARFARGACMGGAPH